MAAMHAAAIAVALTTLAATPILIAYLIVRADDLADQVGEVMDRLPGQGGPSVRHAPIEETAARLRLLTRELRSPIPVAAELAELERSELEHLAADTEPGTESAPPSPEAVRGAARWRAELRREALWISYDEALREACRALAIPHQLDSMVGIDLELERLRLEDELRAAGLVLGP